MVQRAQYYFLARQGCFHTLKIFRERDLVEYSNVFLSAGNNPGVLKNSNEHAEPLFITFRKFHKRHFSMPCVSTDFEHV